MTSFSVVEALDVIKHIGPCFISGAVSSAKMSQPFDETLNATLKEANGDEVVDVEAHTGSAALHARLGAAGGGKKR